MTTVRAKRNQRPWTSRTRGGHNAPVPGGRHDSTDIKRFTTSPGGPAVVSEGEQDVDRRNSMATVKTSDMPQTIATEANGGAPSSTEVVKLDITDPTFMATAYDTYDALREKGRVTRVKFGSNNNGKESQSPRDRFFNRETFFVTHYDDVVATLLDDRFSVDPRSLLPAEQRGHDETPEEFRPFARSIISIDPPDHTRIRKLVQPSFTGRGMEAMRPSIQKTVDDLLDAAERDAEGRGETPGNRRMELVSQFAYPFPVTVISDLLGIPREDREQIRGWTENLLRVDRGRDEAMNEQVRQGLCDFIAYIKELFARKRREPTEDMISRMVLMEDDGDTLTEEETLATVFLMYLAGHVTTVNLVGNGVVALLTHPEQLAALKADPA